MGPCQSKPQPVASAPPRSKQPAPQSQLKKQGSNRSVDSNRRRSRKSEDETSRSKKRPENASAQRSSLKAPVRKTSAIRTNGTKAKPDSRWKFLWEKMHPMLIDPADVHAVLEERIDATINNLSSSQITMLQRRVRHVVKSLGPLPSATSAKLSRFYGSSSNLPSLESKMMAEKQQLLDEMAIRKVLAGGCSLSTQYEAANTFWSGREGRPQNNAIDPVGSAFVLMQALYHNWDLVADLAAETASDLNMDVNHQEGEESSFVAPALPSPLDPSYSDPLPAGVPFSALCFVTALALRGSRYQRMHLLFFLLMPPDSLISFLAAHPAGGVPTFLLEVGNDTIISVASLAHYYFYCRTTLPSDSPLSKDVGEGNEEAGGHLLATCVVDAMATLMSAQVVDMDSENEGTTQRDSESPSRHNSRFRRNSDIRSDKSSNRTRSDWMDYLQDVRDGRTVSYEDFELEGSKERLLKASKDLDSGSRWSMKDFLSWAEDALDDAAIDAFMLRVFTTGILPSPSGERELVLERWIEWQQASVNMWSTEGEGGTVLDHLTQSVRSIFVGMGTESHTEAMLEGKKVWGGLGGIDGKGGLGYGILYCVDKKWWDLWEKYVGWSWSGDGGLSLGRERPGSLSTERLLNRMSDSGVPGTFGSYEVMKHGLTKGVDYVLVPPGVWDMLYELYGGGPPLPRMINPPMTMTNPRERTFSSDSKQMEAEDSLHNVEVLSAQTMGTPMKIPEEVAVATHPWVLTAHVCDAQQPYRRGDAGPTSVRAMVTPDQPLWRLYAELITRLQVNHPKAADADGLGRARLWKRLDTTDTNVKDASSRYGPWSLLCKSRSAILPVSSQSVDIDDMDDLIHDWQAYADHATVESIGLGNGDRIMVEYAVLNKKGDFSWPREAAARAGRVRHLAAEDAKFRQRMKGVDESGAVLPNPPKLTGMPIDAMDASGCWYQVEVLQVQSTDTGTDDSDDCSDSAGEVKPFDYNTEKKETEAVSRQIRVDFGPHGGHTEWIDVDSDRLAKAGRFTMGSDGNEDRDKTSTETSTDSKTKTAASGKKVGSDASTDQNGGGKVCTYPGYGACGLANLGNTCYANSALQCISYMPLLRAYLLSGQYRTRGDLNKDNPLGTGGKLLEEFADLLRVMWSGKYGERTPTRFRSQLGKARSQFSAADQQDAQELLSYLLDVLHEDSNRVKQKPYVEALEDDWVAKNRLARVGQEAWRRFLRRNRSIMADVTMGQVLNTVTCPVCHFSSRNFDPFNLLSLPFPTVADVVFQCTVIRRASAYNCPRILNRPRKGDSGKLRYDNPKPRSVKPPSGQLVYEQYVIAMSRLADIGDLRLQLQNATGIAANRFKLCRVEEVIVDDDAEKSSAVRTYLKTTLLPNKEGPCVQVAKLGGDDGQKKDAPTQIVAFESTLCPRPLQSTLNGHKGAASKEDGSVDEESSSTTDDDDDDVSENISRERSYRERHSLLQLLETYGDLNECRKYDSDPLPISKAMSRCLWPKTEKDFTLGLRVDAIDHRNHWFPGSVVEIVEGVANGDTDATKEKDNATRTKVRIHFDNFSSKWDETYTIDKFQKGQVRPLYSHATPRVKPTEFVVYHRFNDRSKKANVVFGNGFYLQCQNEWSTARAGAHILAQASRFLSRRSDSGGAVDVDDIESSTKVRRLYDRSYGGISDLIDTLIDYDRRYVNAALGIEGDSSSLPRRKGNETFHNSSFDASALSTSLIEKVRSLLHRLPFEIRVCTAEAPLGTKSGHSHDEVSFPFSLMRTVGNFMNARHAVVLHWRDPQLEKKGKNSFSSVLGSPVMYITPEIVIDKASLALLNDHEARKSKNNPGSGGLHLGVCLTEFCKIQQLHLNDNWKCPHCKEFREGKQNMSLWKLPDVLTFHIKRFNCSARWREKISTKINFPLTGLDMSEWYHKESPAMHQGTDDDNVYDLIGVVNHYGGMTGGHYVAACKATPCGPDGCEEVTHSFNGVGANVLDLEEETGVQTGWRLGRSKDKESATTQNKNAAAAASRAASESAEPLWLQFDDELVEPIPPRNVVSEMAYVLFYRRRNMTPSNIAKYSTIQP